MRRSAWAIVPLALLGGCMSNDMDYCCDRDLGPSRPYVPSTAQTKWKTYDDGSSPYHCAVVKTNECAYPSTRGYTPVRQEAADQPTVETKAASQPCASDLEVMDSSTAERAGAADARATCGRQAEASHRARQPAPRFLGICGHWSFHSPTRTWHDAHQSWFGHEGSCCD